MSGGFQIQVLGGLLGLAEGLLGGGEIPGFQLGQGVGDGGEEGGLHCLIDRCGQGVGLRA